MAEAITVSAGHYMYVRHTDTDGNKSVFQYRVWNSQVALQALASNASGENIKARRQGHPDLATVESIDEATYESER